MNITDIRWTYAGDGLPQLELKIDNIPVIILPQQKPYLLDNGIAIMMLPVGQEELLPPVKVPGNRELGIIPFTLQEGATKDKTIIRLTREFVAAAEYNRFEEKEIEL